MDESSRYDKIKELSVNDMAEFLSFYFECDRCPSKRDGCSENDACCMDAIRDWLKQDGEL